MYLSHCFKKRIKNAYIQMKLVFFLNNISKLLLLPFQLFTRSAISAATYLQRFLAKWITVSPLDSSYFLMFNVFFFCLLSLLRFPAIFILKCVVILICFMAYHMAKKLYQLLYKFKKLSIHNTSFLVILYSQTLFSTLRTIDTNIPTSPYSFNFTQICHSIYTQFWICHLKNNHTTDVCFSTMMSSCVWYFVWIFIPRIRCSKYSSVHFLIENKCSRFLFNPLASFL